MAKHDEDDSWMPYLKGALVAAAVAVTVASVVVDVETCGTAECVVGRIRDGLWTIVGMV